MAKTKSNRKRKASTLDADRAVEVLAAELTAQQRGGSVNQVRLRSRITSWPWQALLALGFWRIHVSAWVHRPCCAQCSRVCMRAHSCHDKRVLTL